MPKKKNEVLAWGLKSKGKLRAVYMTKSGCEHMRRNYSILCDTVRVRVVEVKKSKGDSKRKTEKQ